MNLIKWVIKPVFWLVDALVPDNVDLTRLYDGLYGLLVPCIWCPIFLGLWDRHSQQLRREWGVVGVTELPILSPFYRKSNEARSLWARLAKKVGVGICGFAGVVAVFWLTFVQLELEVLTQIIPVCVSGFHAWHSAIIVCAIFAMFLTHMILQRFASEKIQAIWTSRIDDNSCS